MTALPIVETQEGDVSAYIPTNVISITDGQIFLSQDLFNAGIRPAINIGISVSRVGSAAQPRVIKRVAGSLKLQLAQYQELQAFTQFASDLDPETRAILERGARVRESLKQPQSAPLSVEDQAAKIHIITATNICNNLPPEKIASYLNGLLEYLKRTNYAQTLTSAQDLTPEVKEILETAAQEYLNMFN